MTNELRRIEVAGKTRTGKRIHGVDGPAEQRPGVPMEAEPHAVKGATEDGARQQGRLDQHLHRAGLDRLTPVFGTAQPPYGTSGRLRKKAYEIPEHFARHWALLVLADRVDVIERGVGSVLGQAARRLLISETTSRKIERDPLPVALGVAALGCVLTTVLWKRRSWAR